MKLLQASVTTASEWFKERNQSQWAQTRKPVLLREQYTCVYCPLACAKFMQVNHIVVEDDHELENLATVCAAGHRVLHLGINAAHGFCLPATSHT